MTKVMVVQCFFLYHYMAVHLPGSDVLAGLRAGYREFQGKNVLYHNKTVERKGF